MKDNLFKHAMSLTVLVMFLIIAIGSTDDTAIEKDVSSQYVEEVITSQQLYNAYDANEVAADQKYKGKILLVSGEIEDIAKDITDTIYITLKGGEYIGSVQCFFSKSYENKAASLSKRQHVTIKGKCDGKMMNILLRGCELQ